MGCGAEGAVGVKRRPVGMGMDELQRAAEDDEQNANPGKEQSASTAIRAFFVYPAHINCKL
jgi:hypothetical protein